jgi:hypothetical protein
LDIFNPTQKITAKLFYNLIAQLEGDERLGALKALSVLVPITEDGFMTANGAFPRSDFFVQCFDGILGVSLALKMLEDDGLVPKTMGQIHQKKAVKRLTEADAALNRIESMLALAPSANGLSN